MDSNEIVPQNTNIVRSSLNITLPDRETVNNADTTNEVVNSLFNRGNQGGIGGLGNRGTSERERVMKDLLFGDS